MWLAKVSHRESFWQAGACVDAGLALALFRWSGAGKPSFKALGVTTIATGSVFYGVALALRRVPGGDVNAGLADALTGQLAFGLPASLLLPGLVLVVWWPFRRSGVPAFGRWPGRLRSGLVRTGRVYVRRTLARVVRRAGATARPGAIEGAAAAAPPRAQIRLGSGVAECVPCGHSARLERRAQGPEPHAGG